MPLTPAHTAAAWPLSRVWPRSPLDALILGTLTPDFEYFLWLAPRGRFGHSPLGLVAFCLPVGLFTWLVYRWVVRPACLEMLPPGLRTTLAARDSTIWSAAAAILIGAASHIVWDSFTHSGGWAVLHMPALSAPVYVTSQHGLAVFKLLQHASTLVGIVAVGIWVRRWLQRQPRAARAYDRASRSRAATTTAMMLGAGVVGALLNGLRGAPRGFPNALGHAAVGGMAALTIALLVFGLISRARQRPGLAT